MLSRLFRALETVKEEHCTKPWTCHGRADSSWCEFCRALNRVVLAARAEGKKRG